jgi:hypothetical protein
MSLISALPCGACLLRLRRVVFNSPHVACTVLLLLCPRFAASMHFPVTFVSRGELTGLVLLLACALLMAPTRSPPGWSGPLRDVPCISYFFWKDGPLDCITSRKRHRAPGSTRGVVALVFGCQSVSVDDVDARWSRTSRFRACRTGCLPVARFRGRLPSRAGYRVSHDS